MIHEETAPLKTVAQQKEALFVHGVIRIVYQTGAVVQES